jgi:DNA recombination protein RmuC
MLLWIVGLIALVLGLVIGFLVRNGSAGAQIAVARAEKLSIEQRNVELTRDLGAAKGELAQAQAESAARAGFEALALERGKTVEELRGKLEAKTESERSLSARAEGLEADLRNERQNTAEKLALLETAKKALSDQFQALAADILDQKSKTFSEGSQKEIGTLLDPLKTQIKEFREKVEQAQGDSKTGVTEIKTLIGALGNLNKELTEEAHNLATALRRDTKAQGNWGETILRNILDKSGLQKGLHYSFQESFDVVNEEDEPVQRRQTDVVVKLPGGRHLVIDSKVSLNAYSDSVNAENEKDRGEAIKKHLVSVRNHFNELSSKNYQRLSGLRSPDFVVMFVPIEPAFLLALQSDEAIWSDAYEKGVLLSGPTTVLFVTRIVENLWSQENRAKNVEKVMKRGADLYEKFVGFVTNLESVGTDLAKARQSYEEAWRQLSTGPGNLVRQVEMLRELDVKPKTRLKTKFLEEAGVDEPELLLTADPAELTSSS